MATVAQRTRIFWGWEGSSERNLGGYLQLVANELGLPIHFDREHNLIGGGDPQVVVEQSVRVMTRSERARGRYKYRAILLDADRIEDDAEKYNSALRLCAEHKIDLILQQYNHEALLIRHHREHVRMRPTKNRPPRELFAYGPSMKNL